MTGVPGIALIYVPQGVDPRTMFAGRTLAERSRALAAAVGLRPYLVGRPTGTAPGAGIPWVDPGGRLPAMLPTDLPVALWRCDVAFVTGAVRALLAHPASGPVGVRDDLGRIALVLGATPRLAGRAPATLELAAAGCALVEPPGRIEAHHLVALDAAAEDTSAVEAGACGPLAPVGIGAGKTSGAPPARALPVARAEAALVATLDNPRDGLFDRLLNRHLSRRLTPSLLHLPVTPNQVTALSLAVGVLAALALAGPGALWPVAGALLLQLTAVLDCVDGEIARAKVLESEWGELLDITSDSLIHVVVFLGMAVHAWPELGSDVAWSLGALFASGGLASFVVVTRAERSEERWRRVDSWQARMLARMLAVLTTRDLSVLVFAAAVTGLLTELLIGAAFGAHAFWVIALALHRSALRGAARKVPASAEIGAAQPVVEDAVCGDAAHALVGRFARAEGLPLRRGR